jgi:preprotein translocase subunit SecE
MLGVRVPPGLPIFLCRVTELDKIKTIIGKIRQFLRETLAELKKVTWPSPKQTMASTSVVIVVVIVVSLILGLVDFSLTRILRVMLG